MGTHGHHRMVIESQKLANPFITRLANLLIDIFFCIIRLVKETNETIDSIPYGQGIGNTVSFIVLSVSRSWFSPLRACNSAMFFTNFTKLLLVNQYV